MSQNTIQLRQSNPDETEKMAQFQSPDGDAVCASYVAREVADRLGEFAQVTLSEEAEVTATLDNISGSGSGNYAIYETPGGAVTGFYLSHDTWAEVIGEEVERDDEGNVLNAPESIGMVFAASSEEDFEEADSVDEDEVDALLGSDEAEAEDETDDEEEVEISDEELDLVEAE